MAEKTLDDFDHLYDKDLDGFVVDAAALKEMSKLGLVDVECYVNNRPGAGKILEHLENFHFARAVVDQGTITYVLGKVPKSITKDELMLWFNNALYDLTNADDAKFDNETGEFRFWWD